MLESCVFYDVLGRLTPLCWSGAEYGEEVGATVLLLTSYLPIVFDALLSEHTRIMMDPLSGCFRLCDGAFRMAAHISSYAFVGELGTIQIDPITNNVSRSSVIKILWLL